MKKKLVIASVFMLASIAVSVPAYAAGWQKNDTGWWYATNDSGTTWYANEWQWIDGNGDGIAECYCFDADGYMYANTTTPDSYTVNADGAWTVNGVVQTQTVTAQTPETTNSNQEAVPNVTGFYIGSYHGDVLRAQIEEYDGILYAEVDLFLKDVLPPYKGNGVFEDNWNRFVFEGNSLIFTDFSSGETIYFAKQP